MRKNTGLTGLDVIVAVACMVFVLANVPVIIAAGRGRAKQAVCMVNLRTLTDAWRMYAGANNEKVPVGDVWYSWTFPSNNKGGPAQRAWHEWPHPYPHAMPPTAATNYTSAYSGNCVEQGTCLKDAWDHATEEGTMWRYVGDHKVYRCPVGEKGEYVTYAMAHSMNTYCPSPPGAPSAGPGSYSRTITLRTQIKRPSERIVFLDAGVAKRGAFFVVYDGGGEAKWYDRAFRHGDGTVFSFADEHVEFKRWTDPHTLAEKHLGWGNGTRDDCNCDIRWLTKVTWGDVSYSCTNTAKRCEY